MTQKVMYHVKDGLVNQIPILAIWLFLLGFICDEVGFFKEIVLFICHTLGRSL